MLNERLSILKESSVISENIEKIALGVIEFISKEIIVLDENNGSALVTHLALALSRVEKNEECVILHEAVIKQLETEPLFEEAKIFWNDVETKFNMYLPEGEINYMYMHICTLLMNKG